MRRRHRRPPKTSRSTRHQLGDVVTIAMQELRTQARAMAWQQSVLGLDCLSSAGTE
jgi:hypothetical protein